MKAAIKQRARELGFDDCRVTTALPPESGPQFKQWLAQRQHGEMGYLERTARKRIEPQIVLPGARSIITVAVSYDQEWRVAGVECRGPEARRADDTQQATGNTQDYSPSARHSSPITFHASRITHHDGIIARYAR